MKTCSVPERVDVEISVSGRPHFQASASMTYDDIQWLIDTLPGVVVVYWQGMNRITRESKDQPDPVHTRAAYARLRTPRLY